MNNGLKIAGLQMGCHHDCGRRSSNAWEGHPGTDSSSSSASSGRLSYGFFPCKVGSCLRSTQSLFSLLVPAVQVSVERTIGTIFGGLLGLATVLLGHGFGQDEDIAITGMPPAVLQLVRFTSR